MEAIPSPLIVRQVFTPSAWCGLWTSHTIKVLEDSCPQLLTPIASWHFISFYSAPNRRHLPSTVSLSGISGNFVMQLEEHHFLPLKESVSLRFINKASEINYLNVYKPARQNDTERSQTLTPSLIAETLLSARLGSTCLHARVSEAAPLLSVYTSSDYG